MRDAPPSLLCPLFHKLLLHACLYFLCLCTCIADDQVNNLRKELHKIRTDHDSKQEVVKKDLIEKPLKIFIRKCQHMSIDTHMILEVLKKLHTKEPELLSVDAYEWCKREFEKPDPPGPSPVEIRVQPPMVTEVNFCKEVIQNSIVACHLLEQEDMSIKPCAHENSLFEGNKSIGLQILPDRAKSAQHGGLVPVHQYLIASAKGTMNPGNHVIYYIAFSSHQSLKEWSDNYKSFEEGTHGCRFTFKTYMATRECKSECGVCTCCSYLLRAGFYRGGGNYSNAVAHQTKGSGCMLPEEDFDL